MRAEPRALIYREVIRFCATGALNTIVCFAALYGLHLGFGVPVAIASPLAYMLAALNSFTVNKHWTFSASRREGLPALQFGAFMALSLFGALLYTASIELLTLWLPLFSASLTSIAIVLVLNFVTSKFIIFRSWRRPAQ